ncbi:MAG: histidine phosphatase family protein [Woeseiaceae bacterium]
MKTLTVLRHAKSSWKNANLQDCERPLNSRGHRDAPVIAERIKQIGIRPSLILSSPAERAWTTAKIVAREIGYPAEFLQQEDRLYHASVSSLMKLITEQDTGFNNLMIVGHNPGLTDFANYLSPNLTDNIPTCGFVSFTIDLEDWNLDRGIETESVIYEYPKLVAKKA